MNYFSLLLLSSFFLSIYPACTSFSLIRTPSGKKIFLYDEDHVQSESEVRQQLNHIWSVLDESDKQQVKSVIYVEQQSQSYYKFGEYFFILPHLLPGAQKKLNLSYTTLKNCEFRGLGIAANEIFVTHPSRLTTIKSASDHAKKYGLENFRCHLHLITFNHLFDEFERLYKIAEYWRDLWPNDEIKTQFNISLGRARDDFNELREYIATIDYETPLIDIALEYHNKNQLKDLHTLNSYLGNAFRFFLDLYVFHEILLLEQNDRCTDRIALFAGSGHNARLFEHLAYLPGYNCKIITTTKYYKDSPDQNYNRKIVSEEGFRAFLTDNVQMHDTGFYYQYLQIKERIW